MKLVLGLAAIAGMEILSLRVFGEGTSISTYCSLIEPRIFTALWILVAQKIRLLEGMQKTQCMKQLPRSSHQKIDFLVMASRACSGTFG